MFILPNDRKISKEVVEELLDAMFVDQKSKAFFDLQDLCLFVIPVAHKRKLACYQEDIQRFLPLIRVDQSTHKQWMHEFAEEIAPAFDGPQPISAHLKFLDDSSMHTDEMEKRLDKIDPSYLDSLMIFVDDCAMEVLDDWLKDKPLEAKDDPDFWFSDDCEVCKYAKAAEAGFISPTMEGMQTAMEQQSAKAEFWTNQMHNDNNH